MTATTHQELAALENSALHALVKDIGIPPRPSLLVDLQDELKRDEPRMRRMADIVGSDVAMSGALLKAANSPLLGLSRRAETVEHAFMLLGFAQCQAIFTELVLRKALPADGPTLTRFWDVSAKRARAMSWLARSKRIVSPALAHTYGLFMDVGIPVLARRWPGPADTAYLATLARANESEALPFTRVEQDAHGTDHTLVGALTARTWGVSQTAVLAVRLHHEYNAWTGPLPPEVSELLCLGLVSDHIIQRFQGLNRHTEWVKGGAIAMDKLNLDAALLDDWADEVHQVFEETGL